MISYNQDGKPEIDVTNIVNAYHDTAFLDDLSILAQDLDTVLPEYQVGFDFDVGDGHDFLAVITVKRRND